MEAMMAQQMQYQQQMQFQMMMMAQQQQLQDQQQQAMYQDHPVAFDQKGKGKAKGGPKKELEVPPVFQQDKEKYDTLAEFMDACRLEDRHKERLMVSMAQRIDTFTEDLETLQMAMGGARKYAGGTEAALLVSLVKQMEDGEFKPRDEKDRAVFRRAKEIKEEAIAANNLIKSRGSVRERFLAQQRAQAQEVEVGRQRMSSPQSKGRGRSRSHGKKGRSRSRSRGRSRSRSRGRGRSRSRGKRGRSNSRRGRDRR